MIKKYVVRLEGLLCDWCKAPVYTLKIRNKGVVMGRLGKIEIDDDMIKALSAQKIKKLTEVQELVYEDIIDHKDIVVQSETGSGKTLAYLLPLYEKYKEIEHTNKIIIVVPTQELALQVHRQIELLSKNSGREIHSAAIFGNVNIERQIKTLRSKPMIVVGTAIRITELIKKKKIAAHNVKTIVLDEADKLLDKKSVDDVKALIKCTMKDRQLLLFSASMPSSVIRTVKELAPDIKILRISDKKKIPKNIEHLYVVTKRNERIEMLRRIISASKKRKAMIFINGKHDIEEAVMKLKYHNYPVEAIYGGVSKQERQRAIEGFRSNKLRYLIATDIAARGLHFNNVEFIVQLKLTEDINVYLHRAGRTGRNGAKGRCISIVTENEISHLMQISKKLGFKPQEIFIKEGRIIYRK